MKYLLDTCALIRLLDSPEKISVPAISAMKSDNSATMGVASISLWEVARKESLGNLELAIPANEWLREIAANEALSVLSLSDRIAWESCHLPGEFHRDPADRIIVATARIMKVTLVTSDRRILQYPHIKTLKA
jgi:PIN domain nuclease of toxin-antitoxin system